MLNLIEIIEENATYFVNMELIQSVAVYEENGQKKMKIRLPAKSFVTPFSQIIHDLLKDRVRFWLKLPKTTSDVSSKY